MEILDKTVIGERIRSLRKSKGLRQWQMAERLGATQPAIHKYENGILPEVKRLLELARVGNTTVEWILTGQHWEGGSEERERLPREIYELAGRFHRFSREELRILLSALELLEKAARCLPAAGSPPPPMSLDELGRALQDYDRHARPVITAALALYESILSSLTEARIEECNRLATATPAEPEAPAPPEPTVQAQGEVS